MGLAAFDAPAPYTDAGLRPKRVLLPLRQHVGKPAEATAETGERVRRGDVVGEIPEKALGAKNTRLHRRRGDRRGRTGRGDHRR